MENNEKCILGSKMFKDSEIKALRKDLKPGNYSVDTLIRVHGDVTVNEPEMTTPTFLFLSEDFVTHLLGVLGCTQENAANALIKAAKLKLEGAAPSATHLAAMEKGKLAFKKMVESMPKVERQGKMLGHLSVDEVTYVQVAGPAVAEKKTA